MNNKKGQIGDLIVIMPTLILTFLIMAIFVVVVWLFSGLHVVSGADISASSESSLLLQKVNIDGKDKMVFDVLKERGYFSSHPISFEEKLKIIDRNVMNSLGEIMNENKNCLAVFRTTQRSNLVFAGTGLITLELVDGKATERYFLDDGQGWKERTDYLESKFGWPESFQQISYDAGENEILIYSYYGKCKEVENE